MAHSRRVFILSAGAAAVTAGVPRQLRADAPQRFMTTRPELTRAWLTQSQQPGRLNARAIRDAIAHRDHMPVAHLRIKPGARWQFIGPAGTSPSPIANLGQFPTSGRVNAVAFDPSSSETIYAGAPGGGVWKCTGLFTSGNAPAWEPLSDNWPMLAVSSIAVDSTGQNIYAGTGDCPGLGTLAMGVMKSTDAGKNWTNVSDPGFSGSRISRVVINPDSQTTVLAADFEPRGNIWYSTDSGTMWTSVQSSLARWLCIEFGASSMGTRSAYAVDSSGALYRSDDGGSSWVGLNTPVSAPGLNRPQIACSPTTAGTLYLYSPADKKIWSHTNYGKGPSSTWQDITYNWSDPDGPASRSYKYCMACSTWTYNVTKPTDVLWVGSFGLSMMVLGTSNWIQQEGVIKQGHADMHAVAVSPLKSNVLLIANDGGVFLGQYGKGSPALILISINKNLTVPEVYKIALANSTVHKDVLGGMQDTGSAFTTGSTTSWTEVISGDGGACAVSQTDSANQATTSDFYSSEMQLVYTSDRWASSKTLANSSNELAQDPRGIAPPLMFDPITNNSIYLGVAYLYRYDISSSTWENRLGGQALAGSGSYLLAMAITSTNGGKSANRIYTGSLDGQIWMSDDAGTMWTQINANLPASSSSGQTQVHALAVDPNDGSSLLAALYTINGNGGLIWHCSDTTATPPTWVDVSSTGSPGGLPSSFPLRAVARDLFAPGNTWFVGGDLGVFYTDDAGVTWSNVTQPFGLPNAIVTDLQTSAVTQSLYAATLGRGIYQIALSM